MMRWRRVSETFQQQVSAPGRIPTKMEAAPNCAHQINTGKNVDSGKAKRIWEAVRADSRHLSNLHTYV